MSNFTEILRRMRLNKLLTITPTHLEYINTLIIRYVEPDYHIMENDRFEFLFAHIHAMQECDIITYEELDENICEFIKIWSELLDDPELSYDDSMTSFFHPSEEQRALTLELSLQVYNKEPIAKLKQLIEKVMKRRCEGLLDM